MLEEPKEHGHLSDEQIVQYVLETAGDEETRHLYACEHCRAEAESYRRTLRHLDRWSAPERPPDYGSLVWRKLRPQVERRPAFRWLGRPAWGWASLAAVGALVALALLVSTRRHSNPSPPSLGVQSATPPERLLQAAVKEHVEHAELLLSEIETRATSRSDPGSERQAIRDLVEANRLYRQTAEQEDDRKTADLLADLETALVALKHDPQKVSAADARDLRNRLIKAAGLNRSGSINVSSSDSEKQGVKRVPL
jgi:hypothetical protein